MSNDSLSEALWSAPPASRRGPKPRVGQDMIIDAAVRTADEQGADAASMQRIANDLGVTKMALYRHVPGRPEMVALMIEAALGPAPEPSGAWREGLRQWADAMYIVFARHRWLSAFATGARLIGPVELSWMESGLAAMTDLKLNGMEKLDTLVLIGSLVRGMVEQRRDRHDGWEQTMQAQLLPVLKLREDEFPLTAAAFADRSIPDSSEQAYEFGLNRILDGVENFVATR